MPARTDLPEKFGRFRIIRLLGEGGMGAVHLVEDTELGPGSSPLALKIPRLDGDPRAVERFQREARLAQSVHHPYVCPVYEADQVEGVHYLTMPFVEGDPLSALVSRGQPWEAPRAAGLARRLALALQALHKQQIIHRDLKPHNVMVRPSGEPMLMDFGLAFGGGAGEKRLTSVGRMLGTPAYVAPEQVAGDLASIGPATDVYGLGVILFELLTGRLPFEADNLMTLFYAIINEPPPSPLEFRPGLDERLAEVCLKALSKKPAERQPGMAALMADLDGYLCRARLQAAEAPTVSAEAPPPAASGEAWPDTMPPGAQLSAEVAPQEQTVEVTVPGLWFVRPADDERADWASACATPGRVRVRPGEAHRLVVGPRATDAQLEGLAPLCRLASLRDLDLTDCKQVTDAVLAQMREVACLHRLFLGGCTAVTDEGLANLRGIASLRTLCLRGCAQVTDAGLAHLRQLASLRTLELARCVHVSGAGLAQLRRLPSLRNLDLGGCAQVRDEGLAHLRQLSLQTLCLKDCVQITDTGLAHLRRLTSLQALDLGLTQVTDAGLAHLGRLTSLRSLSLGGCRRLADAGLAHLRSLVSLQTIDLFGCEQITDAGLAHLAGLASLQTLYLGGCKQVSDGGLTHLRRLPSLRNLFLDGCLRVTDAGVAGLLSATPGCEVIR